MKSRKKKVYVCGGWFSSNQDEVLTSVENLLRERSDIKPYFPRHDGVKLSPNEFHDPALREKVFLDNVEHIESADFCVACCDGRDGNYDTGTQWEIGYAMANNIPVIAYDTTNKIYENMESIVEGFLFVCHTLESLSGILDEFCELEVENRIPKKVLFVGPDSTEEQRAINEKLVSSVIVESCGSSGFRWLTNITSSNIGDNIEGIFKDIDYMVAIIDDRHPIVSWLMGQAYSRNIPVISYTNYDYGVNIMLLVSILSHVKGEEALRAAIQQMKREGIYSLPDYDNSKVKAI